MSRAAVPDRRGARAASGAVASKAAADPGKQTVKPRFTGAQNAVGPWCESSCITRLQK